MKWPKDQPGPEIPDVGTIPELRSSKLLEFGSHEHQCPKCGWKVRKKLPRFIINFFRLQTTCYRPMYCKGGMEPEGELAVHLPGGAALSQKMMIMCAGITEEHMHWQCANCNYIFLTRVMR